MRTRIVYTYAPLGSKPEILDAGLAAMHYDSEAEQWFDSGPVEDNLHLANPVSERTLDYPAFTYPHMQDFIHDKYPSGPLPKPIDASGGLVFIAGTFGTGIRTDWENILYGAGGIGVKDYSPAAVMGTGIDLYTRHLTHPYTREAVIDLDPFKNEFTIWSLLRDVYDAKKLGRQLLKLRKPLTRLVLGLRDGASIREVSQSYLAQAYGIRPTLSDITEFFGLLDKWRKLYTKENKILNRIHTAHNPVVEIEPGRIESKTFQWRELGASVNGVMFYNIEPLMLFQTTKYYFVCPKLTGFLSRLRQWVDLLGVLDPAALWDNIPFSFVVDWVWDVSQWLNRNAKPKLFTADVVICDWAESLMQHCYTSGQFTYRSFDQFGTDETTLQNLVTEPVLATRYARRRQFPCPIKVRRTQQQIKQFTIGKAILGTALVGAGGIVKFKVGKPSRYRKNHQ